MMNTREFTKIIHCPHCNVELTIELFDISMICDMCGYDFEKNLAYEDKKEE